jgi:hypothetical protein
MDYLLSRGALGGSQKERILSSVHEVLRTDERRQKSRKPAYRGILAGVLVTAAAACFLILARPPAPKPEPPGTGLRSKGATGTSPVVEMACLGATLTACPRHSVLAFSVAGEGDAEFVTAYADPADSSSSGSTAERIWYLTSEPLAARAPGADATRVLPKAGRIGDEHRVGSYRVHLLLTRHPISRADVMAGALAGDSVVARATYDLVVTP